MQHSYPCQMSPEESDIYFSSDWYKEQVIRRRFQYVLQGVIKTDSKFAEAFKPKPVRITHVVSNGLQH